jgi:hypothetical protein
MPRKIKYCQLSPHDEFNPLMPIKTKIPKWYKETPLINPNSNKNLLPISVTVKACPPFLDAFTTGYALTLIADIGITQTPDGVYISWKCKEKICDIRKSKLVPDELVPTGFDPAEFIWNTNAVIKAPAGYAMLFTHPLNRPDLPFYTLSGVVDGGWSVQDGNLPFFIKQGFEGIIPMGTPFAQIIPFKVEPWILEKDPSQIEEGTKNNLLTSRVSMGWYKSTHWKKKNYE